MIQATQPSAIAASTAAQQQTLAAAFECHGVGLHSGLTTTVRVSPAPPDTGRQFLRCDRPNAAPIPAHISAVHQTLLSTELMVEDGNPVRTVEHLLAALVGLGVDNAVIEVDGPELPLLDGSAQDWVSAIATVGLTAQAASRSPIIIQAPVSVQDGDAFVVAMPAPETRYTYGIDFDLPAIGNQWHSWAPQRDRFEDAIAPARTFGLAHQIEALRSQGLIQGGSLDNALVCDRTGWLNPPLRFDNEPARHKLLDLIGDLSLLGSLPQGHIIAYKASHGLHVKLAQTLANQSISG
ncbi:MAG: UDP-3-O-acyl-N-acetylglucosamine deacetylase [Leptolyngbyaceae cyanobacterium T60_A2020_046]|nr:UDP-3-O-acyl-N-acetylglucosamine deacetylase [Leptolyngbyaceae cyanobacterium T60_A2020_046]